MTKRARILSAAVAVLIPLAVAFAQDPAAPAEAQPDRRIDLSKLASAQRFDFLIGDWTYESTTGHGSTSYRRAAEGTIVEHLEPGFIRDREFMAFSIFLHDPEAGWKQNWVDTLGNVLEGGGGMREYHDSDLPAMITEFTQGGNKFRHVWYDIREDRFETDLFISMNDGAWRMIRRMPYLRKKGAP